MTANDTDGDAIANGGSYQVFVLSIADGSNANTDVLSAASSTFSVLGAASVASGVAMMDIADNGNGTDLEVGFNKGVDENTISEYRIIVVQEANAGSFDLAAAQGVMMGNYTTVAPNGSATYTQTLAASANDASGTAIGDGTKYQTFILSVANSSMASTDALSMSSDTLTLQNLTNTADLTAIGGRLYATPSFVLVEVPNDLLSPDLEVLIYSMNGQRMRQQSILDTQTIISTESLIRGAYFVVLQNKEKRWVKKFVR